MTSPPSSPPPADHRRGQSPIGAVLALGVLVLVVLVGAVAVLSSSSESDGRRGTTAGIVSDDIAPLDLATVADSTALHYLAAEDHPATYQQVPCFCGCEEFLGHRHLLDCFVRADGQGWDAHAAGCGICIAESATVQALLDEDHDTLAIRDAVIAQYGAVPPTTVPTTLSSRS